MEIAAYLSVLSFALLKIQVGSSMRDPRGCRETGWSRVCLRCLRRWALRRGSVFVFTDGSPGCWLGRRGPPATSSLSLRGGPAIWGRCTGRGGPVQFWCPLQPWACIPHNISTMSKGMAFGAGDTSTQK